MNKSTLLLIGILSSLGMLFTVPQVNAQMDTVTPTVTPTPTSTNRTETRAEALARLKEANLKRAKELAGKIFKNHFLEKLNSVRARVTSNATLGPDAKAVLLTKIDEELTWFTTQMGKVNDATTLEQVRTFTKEARVRFLQVGKDVRKLYISHGFVTSLEMVVKNLESNIVPKIENKLTTLSSSGKDTTTEMLLLEKAKTEIATIKTEILEIRNSTTFDIARKNYEEARAQLKLVRQDLKDLLELLKTKV